MSMIDEIAEVRVIHPLNGLMRERKLRLLKLVYGMQKKGITVYWVSNHVSDKREDILFPDCSSVLTGSLRAFEDLLSLAALKPTVEGKAVESRPRCQFPGEVCD